MNPGRSRPNLPLIAYLLSCRPRIPLRPFLCVLYVASLLLPGVLEAQSTNPDDEPEDPPQVQESPEQERLKTGITARRWIRRVVDGEAISCLIENVLIDRDSLLARCDSAHQYHDRHIYELFGNVRLRQLDKGVVTCDRTIYYQLDRAADFFGNTRVVEGDMIGTAERGESRDNGRLLRLIDNALLVTPEYTVWGDTLLHDRVNQTDEAFGNLRIIDPDAQTLVTGQHAEFAGGGEVAIVDRDPVLTSRERGGSRFRGVSGIMQFFRSEERVVMLDSVRIYQGQTEAYADTAVIYGKQRMVLRGSPMVLFEGTSNMIGEEIEFRYLRGQLDRIILRGKARMEDSTPDSLAAIYSGLPPLDILEGDTLTIEFVDRQINRSVVIGNARSIYTPIDMEDEVATNNVVGDTIIIHFQEAKVREVDVYGNMTGQYRFARIAELAAAMSDSSSAAGDSIVVVPTDSLLAMVDSTYVVSADSALALVDSTGLAMADSALTGSGTAIGDTNRVRHDFTTFADVVDYEGGYVNFQLVDKKIEIQKDAHLVYGTLDLTAETVIFDTVDRELYADGDPLLVDAETIAGQQMGYHFGARSGAVKHGVVNFDNSYYVGDQIRRFDDGTLKILGGKMTACDLATPHYHFWSDKMKIRLKDKVVAKPVVLKVGRVPVFALPFYFKSLKSGRRSGIIFPTFDFGWNSREGRFIRNLGYFWATNDYTDFRFEGDYTENRELTLLLANRYVKRYAFTGNFNYSHQWRLGANAGARQWQLRWNHTQDHLFDDYNFRADVQMASQTLSSNDLSRNTSRDVISGQLRSNVHVSRNFSFMSSSVALSRDERVNSADDDPATDKQIYTQTLPSVNFGFQQWQLLPPLRTGQKGNFLGDLLRATYFKQSYNGKSSRTVKELTTLSNEQAAGSWSLSVRPPRIGIFNATAGVSAGHSWQRSTNRGRAYQAATDPEEEGIYNDIYTRQEDRNSSLSLNSGVNTTLYGIIPARLGRLRALRHTLSVRASYALRPSLGDKQKRSESYAFSVDNRFDVKYLGQDDADSALTEKKLDGLLDWSLSTKYNPDAEPDKRWSNVSSSLSVKPSKNRNLALKVSNTIDPYRMSLLSTRFSYSLNMRGKIDTGHEAAVVEVDRNQAIDRLGVVPMAADTLSGEMEFDDDLSDAFRDDSDDNFYDTGFAGLLEPVSNADGQDATEGGRFLPWNCGGSVSYNHSASGSATVRANMSLSAVLTRNWDFSYQTSFDLAQGKITNQRWSLNRNLHCWRIEFTRIINSVNSEYAFRLYLISMPEVKVPLGNDDLLGSVRSVGSGFMP